MVFAAWFIVFNEEDEEYYLWERKKAYMPPVTLADYKKVLPPGKSLMSLTEDEMQYYRLLIPISKRVAQGVLWNQVTSGKAGLLKEQIQKIEEIEKYGGALQVKAVVGWSAYPGVRKYRK